MNYPFSNEGIFFARTKLKKNKNKKYEKHRDLQRVSTEDERILLK